jgi:hypothetical protein
MSDKVYLNGLIIKGRENQFGEEELKVSVKVEDLVKELQQHQERGWVNLEIRKKKQPSDKGVSHYTVLDTWKPDTTRTHVGQAPGTTFQPMEDNDLPF